MKSKVSIMFLLFLGIIILLMGCASTEKEDNSLEEIKKKGEFVVGLDDNFPPMGFKDENGEIVGFDIDLAKEAAKRMGVNVKFKAVDWDGVLLSLKNKDIDVIWNGLTITEERQRQINFSKVYLQNRQIIVVNNNSNIKSKEDLDGKIVGVQLGSSSENALNSDEIVKSLKEIRKFSNNTEALMDLKAGRVDAVVVDEIVGRYYIEKKPGVYKVLEDDFGRESYGVGIRKEDIKFKEELDKILDEMKNDGTAKKISQKWFGEDIVAK
ncbi:amino acid ABC transporter substrate-binding protein [Tepidibacter formicigenes]|jgi:polar amino acid transport system substrate-binding protein|uniref:Amino acid ABC transporter substrate-binding protein, PAAT family (TC 3.A.1.3.-) n=1 Tax=Tepidibacter formicigenes DSM 15518 TaxID=1123349 RepID=A0A1M6MK26_9FIRM|nr:amino acid ABC transporter substrate-binding protein [Tepidibacter formicigenes]SHJ83744.1 amino acid ABC transporter substrate-binding protein, PAAT family (TC 3.A.1.3.-) [Tepidibacter formicigenes DSM 15518]